MMAITFMLLLLYNRQFNLGVRHYILLDWCYQNRSFYTFLYMNFPPIKGEKHNQ